MFSLIDLLRILIKDREILKAYICMLALKGTNFYNWLGMNVWQLHPINCDVVVVHFNSLCSRSTHTLARLPAHF